MRKRIILVIMIMIVIISDILAFGINVEAMDRNESLFTDEELKFIQETDTITIGNLPARAPLSQYNPENRAIEGINEDILNDISGVSGLKFEFKVCALGAKPIDELKAGKFDLVAGIVRTDKFLSDNELSLSDTFLSSNVVPIIKKGNKYNPNKKLTIALPSSFEALDDYIKTNYPNFIITYYEDNNACLQAVADEKADVTMQNEYLLNYELQNPRFYNLEIVKAYFFKEESSIASLKSVNPLLMSIINKSIKAIQEDSINQIIAERTADTAYEYTLSDIIYEYRFQLAIIGILVFICAFMFAINMVIRKRNIIILRQKNIELSKTMEALKEEKNRTEEYFKEMLNLLPGGVGIFEVTLDNVKIVFFNDAVAELAGYSKGECKENTIENALTKVHPQDVVKIREKIDEAVSGTGEFICTYRLMQKNMDYRWVTLKASIIEKKHGSYTFYGAYSDVNQLKVRAEKDALTGLYNKQAFREIVSQDLTRRPKMENGFKAMILIDIDNFKGVNDNYGHSYGDFVLKKVSSEIVNIFRRGDIIARLGGDEFCVYIPENIPKDIVFDRIEKMRQKLLMSFSENGVDVQISASIGVAFTDGKNIDYKTLIENADKIQYKAKKSGKNKYDTCIV